MTPLRGLLCGTAGSKTVYLKTMHHPPNPFTITFLDNQRPIARFHCSVLLSVDFLKRLVHTRVEGDINILPGAELLCINEFERFTPGLAEAYTWTKKRLQIP